MFETTLVLAQNYFEWAVRESPTGFSGHHANELRERLQQLDFLHARIKECELLQTEKGFADALGAYHNFFQLKLYVEAFYLFAGRILQFTTHRSQPLPRLKFNAPGVREVRNHLIQHPEGSDSLNFNQNFGFDPVHGMTLKNAREPGQPVGFVDRGFTVNCAEFKKTLEHALAKAVR